MHDIKGHYGGVNTLFVANHGRFDYELVVAQKYKSLKLEGQNDIKVMVSRLKEEKNVLPKSLGEIILKQAKINVPDILTYKNK